MVAILLCYYRTVPNDEEDEHDGRELSLGVLERCPEPTARGAPSEVNQARWGASGDSDREDDTYDNEAELDDAAEEDTGPTVGEEYRERLRHRRAEHKSVEFEPASIVRRPAFSSASGSPVGRYRGNLGKGGSLGSGGSPGFGETLPPPDLAIAWEVSVVESSTVTAGGVMTAKRPQAARNSRRSGFEPPEVFESMWASWSFIVTHSPHASTLARFRYSEA